MAWAELLQVFSFLIFASILLFFIYKCNQVKKKLLKRRERNIEYVRTKTIIEEYLNYKETEHQMSRFENIVASPKKLIVNINDH
jgi:hypothetical protein